MPSTSDTVFDKLSRFLAYSSRIMGDQAIELNADLQRLSLQFRSDITSQQDNKLEVNIKRSRFLMREIISYWEVYDIFLKYLHQPDEIDWTQVELHSIINHAAEDAKLFTGSFLDFVIIDPSSKQQFANTSYPLLRHAISSLIIWTYLLAPFTEIFVNVINTNSKTTIKVSKKNTTSTKVDIMDEEVIGFLAALTELIMSLLKGTINWKPDQILLDKDELIIEFPNQSNR